MSMSVEKAETEYRDVSRVPDNDPSWLGSAQYLKALRFAASRLRTARLNRARLYGTHTEQEWLQLKKLCNSQCLNCGASPVVKDHVIPLCHPDSSDSIDNLQPLCSSCNSRKSNKRTDYRGSVEVARG